MAEPEHSQAADDKSTEIPALELDKPDVALVNILVVDDNPGDRYLCKAHLKRSETYLCRTVEAQDLTDALARVQHETFDCVLVDQFLPDGSGIESIGKLRLAAKDPLLPVIVLTGKGDEAIAVDAFQNGASDYLAKDRLNAAALLRAITNAVEKTQLRRQIDKKHALLRRSNRELRTKNAEIKTFYQTVSHELRTPLTAIREYNAIVVDGLAGEVNPQQREYLEVAINGCDRLTRLVDDLFDTARIETGKLTLEFEQTSVQMLLRSCEEVLKPAVEKQGLKLVTVLNGPLPLVSLDPGRIQQVIVNLVNNAIKNTEEGSITVQARSANAGRMVEISVSDTGCGISADDQQSIFERYFQTSPVVGDFQEGMGVGLYLCAEIARRHSGSISVDSSPGAGSTFVVHLPIQQPQ